MNSAVIVANVRGSVGVTDTSIERITPVRLNATASPRSIPTMLNCRPSVNTSRRMPRGSAPHTMRIPISAVRSRTVVARTPYRPTAASTTATTAKRPIRVAANRVGPLALSTNACIGCTSAIGTRASTSATAAAIADVWAAGSPLVRTAHRGMPYPKYASTKKMASRPAVVNVS